jgi:RsiW-degrading membrane proteinase PrsW (M82 family)
MLILVVSPIPIVAMVGDWDDDVLLCWGIGMAFLAAGIEVGVDKAFNDAGLPLNLGAKALLLYGLVEESLKYFAITTARYPLPQGRRLVGVAVACAVGFASTENFFYVSGFSKVIHGRDLEVASMARIFLPFVFHLVNAPLLVCGHIVERFKPIAGVALATLLHWFYDFFLSAQNEAGVKAGYVVIVVGFLLSAATFRKASALQRGAK